MNASLPQQQQATVLYANALSSIPLKDAAAGVAEAEGFYDTAFDRTYGAFWAYLRPSCPRKFTPALIGALRQGQQALEARVQRELAAGRTDRVRYQVFASRIPRVFSLGGDLEFFRSAIETGDREGLAAYARDCVDLVYANATNYGLPITTVSLVQGDALGGGFEAALAANVIVAERQCKMGFPEVLLNMFPGMGAYQLLARRLPPVQAERLILSGRLYAAEELYDMGVIDVLVDEGHGEEAVWGYIRRHHRQARGAWGLRRAMQTSSPFRYEALAETAAIWVDTVLGLSDKDLKRMSYLMRAHDVTVPRRG